MIYELKTYDLRPHSVPEVERRIAESYDHRREVSAMAGSFHTEIGPLNQVVQLWPYENPGERERLLNKAATLKEWPPDIGEFVVNETTEVFIPFSFSPTMAPGNMGPYFEMRMYAYSEGDLPRIEKAWEAALPERLKWSPLVVICHSEDNRLRRLLHVWCYKSLDQRADVRRAIRQTGMWPPHVLAKKLGWPGYTFIQQESRILIPSSCSPLQ